MKKRILKNLLFLIVMMWGNFFFAQTVKGKVTSGEAALPGASVMVEGTKNGTITNFDGTFVLNNVTSNDKLIFSYVGYKNLSLQANTQSIMQVVMVSDSQTLDEVVVIGYGTSKRKDLTGAISSVKAADLQNQSFTSIDQALVGKAAGVTVSQNSGAPGGGISVKIRGITSINGNEPLYVIDGTPIFADRNNTTLDLGSATGGGSGQNVGSALSGVNMSDIESIDILKDASATAIYGANGSNGVVLITTKKGKKGKTTISYDNYTGIQSVAKYYDIMNLQQFAQYTTDLLKSDNRSVPFEFQNPSLLGSGTNWQKEIFRNALVTNNQLAISGEKSGTRFYTSLGYFKQDGVIINSDFERISLRLNVDSKVNNWLKIGNNMSLSNTKQHIVKNDDRGGIVSSALRLSPLIPVRYPNGSYGAPSGGANGAANNYEAVNPVAYSEYVNNRDQKFKVNGNLFADISLTKSLTLRSELGYDLNAGSGKIFIPTYDNIGTAANTINSSFKQQDQSYYWNVKNYLTYNQSFNKHSVNVVLGNEKQKSNYEYLYGARRDIAGNNEYDNLILGGKLGQEVNNASYAWAMESYISRANYNYDSKYYLTVSLRADASSNFGPNNKWGYFPSVSGAWTISNENFMKSIEKTISLLKLRVGYGSVGNQNIPSFLYQTQLGAVNSASGLSYNYTVNGNPDVKWETLKSTNIGLELGMFNNAVKLDVDVYQKVSSDLLIQQPSGDRTAGRVLPYENTGELVNKGIDISLNTVNFENKNFSWNTTFIYTSFTNKLTKFYNGDNYLTGMIPQIDGDPIYSKISEGESLGQIYGYVTDGIFKTQAEVTSSPKQEINTGVGDIKFKNLNDDNVIDQKDKTFLGSAIPKFTFSLNNKFRYKDFDLSIVVNGSYGNKIYNQNRFYTEGLRFLGENQSTNAFNYFVVNKNADASLNDAANSAETTNVPRIDLGNSNLNTRISDRFVEDGSYIRIQNITFGYNLDTNFLSKTNFFTKARVFVSGQNLFTFTKYTGLDPEVGSRNSDIKLAGLDVGRYPVAKTITVGVNLEF